jgi:rhodanese-related sulfurtransferase
MKRLLWLLVGFFVAWEAVWWGLGVKSLFPWQVKAKEPALVWLDVRTPWEFHWFHHPGAQNRPSLVTDLNSLGQLAPQQPLLIVCMTGHRSPLVAYRLQKQGLAQVYHLAGGMAGWQVYRWLGGGK